MILNIRGTSGSGKSTVVTQLMRRDVRSLDGDVGPVPLDINQRVIGYNVMLPSGTIRIVGKYETQCGGCDGIKTQQEVCDRVREFARRANHVVFEGLLVSQIYTRYADLAMDFNHQGKHPYLWLQLDTPLDLCVERVRARRLKAGNTKPFDPDNSLVPKWHSGVANFKKAQADGLNPVWLDHLHPLDHLSSLARL